MNGLVWPKPLKEGACIALIAPCSPVKPERALECIELLKNMGFRVKAADNLATKVGGFMAGDAIHRASIIHDAFADPEVDAIFSIRGGEGGGRLLPYLNLPLIAASKKIFVGYSDVTPLHLLFNQDCGFVTFHGPMVSSNMHSDFDEETKASFYSALTAETEYVFHNPSEKPAETLRGGKTEGILIGGNVSLLSSTVGTIAQPKTRGKILFLEEVDETMGRLDRFLFHLKNAGLFDGVAGIVLGQFTDCTNKEDPSYDAMALLRDVLSDVDAPILSNIQSGHDVPMMTLPLGAWCRMDADAKTLVFPCER